MTEFRPSSDFDWKATLQFADGLVWLPVPMDSDKIVDSAESAAYSLTFAAHWSAFSAQMRRHYSDLALRAEQEVQAALYDAVDARTARSYAEHALDVAHTEYRESLGVPYVDKRVVTSPAIAEARAKVRAALAECDRAWGAYHRAKEIAEEELRIFATAHIMWRETVDFLRQCWLRSEEVVDPLTVLRGPLPPAKRRRARYDNGS